MEVLKVIQLPDEDEIRWGDETVAIMLDGTQVKRFRFSGLLGEEDIAARLKEEIIEHPEELEREVKDPTERAIPTKWLQDNAPEHCPECPKHARKLLIPDYWRCYAKKGHRHKGSDVAIVGWEHCNHARCRECAIREWGSGDSDKAEEVE